MIEKFLDAVRAGDMNEVREMLRRDGELINSRNADGDSAVLLATYNGKMKVAEFLVNNGAKLTIFEASAVGKIDAVKALLNADPSLINAYSHDGSTPLRLAVFFGHQETVEFLISKGASVNAHSKNKVFARGVTPLHSAVASGRKSIVEFLLHNDAGPNSRNDGGSTPLLSAAFNGDVELVRMPLDHGSSVNAIDNNGKTSLSIALEKNHTEGVRILRENGAN